MLGSVAIILSIMLVGNVSVATNEYYRFPGPYVYGTDTRSATAELIQTVRWFRATEGINNVVVADRYTGLAFWSFGLDWTPPAGGHFPTWELYFWRTWPSHVMLAALERSATRYMVVDERMSRYLPYLGVYFSPDEPARFMRATPPPAAAIHKYETWPGTIKIYQSDNLTIYRFNLAALHIPWTPSSGPRQPRWPPERTAERAWTLRRRA